MNEALLAFAIDILSKWYRDQATIDSQFATRDADYEQSEQAFRDHVKHLSEISGLTTAEIRQRILHCIEEAT